MKTTGFRTLVLGTPWRNLTYCIIETDAGITGIGEARVLGKTHTVSQYLRDVERHIIGHDPFDIESLYRRFTLLDFGKPGEVVYTGLALVELAFWDIIGKACGQPVYKLLGGQVAERVQAYANGWYTVEREPSQFAAAAERVLERGYRAMKFDPFGNGDLELERDEFYRSLDLIEAVASVAGTRAQMMIEMHGRFAPHQAREIARQIERFNIGWIEEPVRPGDVPALASVRAHSGLPIATGERLYGAPGVSRGMGCPDSGCDPTRHHAVRRDFGGEEDRIYRRDLLNHGCAAQRRRHSVHHGGPASVSHAAKREDLGAFQRLRRPARKTRWIRLSRGGGWILPCPRQARLGDRAGRGLHRCPSTGANEQRSSR